MGDKLNESSREKMTALQNNLAKLDSDLDGKPTDLEELKG